MSPGHSSVRKTAPPLFNRRRLKRDEGYYLVEALVCCLIVGIISAGLADGYAKIKSFSTHSQTELQAIAIAQECIDELRAADWSLVSNPANQGDHLVTVVGAPSVADPLFPRPLLRDTVSLVYYSKQTNTSTGLYSNAADDSQAYIRCTNNQVLVNVSNGNIVNTVVVTVTVTWADGGGFHTYSTQTTLTAGGLNG